MVHCPGVRPPRCRPFRAGAPGRRHDSVHLVSRLNPPVCGYLSAYEHLPSNLPALGKTTATPTFVGVAADTGRGGVAPGGSGGHGHQLVVAGRGASCLQDSAALPLRAAAPDPVLDPVRQRVLQAGCGDRAAFTDQLGERHADSVVWEEDLGVGIRTAAPCHPDRVHGSLFSTFSSAPPVTGVFLAHRTENPCKAGDRPGKIPGHRPRSGGCRAVGGRR